jgi:hypothetical protein
MTTIVLLYALIVVVVIVVAVVGYFRVRRRDETAQADPSWQPTQEVFRDPKSNRLTRVWVDPAGGRHYVREAG